jgi:acyl transferase domain-containing protein
MSERHTTSSEAEQELVFDLMRERLFEMFGPGGSFRITLGRATAEDAVFVSTVADTVAHHVATAFNPQRESSGRRVAAATTMAEHDELWKQIETELLVRRTGPDSVDVDVEREVTAAREGGSLAERLIRRAA